MVIELIHNLGSVQHLITAEVWAAQPATTTSPAEEEAYDILACELLLDGFRFDGTLSDATIQDYIRANKKRWVEITPKHPYNASASIAEVIQQQEKYSHEKVAAAKEIYNLLNN